MIFFFFDVFRVYALDCTEVLLMYLDTNYLTSDTNTLKQMEVHRLITLLQTKLANKCL